MNWTEFHFLRPLWLSGFVLLPLLVIWLYRHARQPRDWQKVCDAELLPYVVETQSGGARSRATLWILFASTLLLLALAGPAWQRVPQPVFEENAALVILLDTSRSMDAQDIKPSRLERAKLKVSDLLVQRETGQTALISYAAEPYVVSPLTTDAKTVDALVFALSTDIMPNQGSNTAMAIDKAIALLDNAGARGHILLISDGINEALTQPAIERLRAAGLTLSIIGVGSSDGAPIPLSGPAGGFFKDGQGNIVIAKLEDNSLRRAAQASGGYYSSLTVNDRDLERTAALQLLAADQVSATELLSDQWEEQGPWLLLPILGLALLVFRRGALSSALVFVLWLPCQESQAAQWQDLFRNSDQQGASRFEQQQYEQSVDLFDDPQWRASAQYRAGDFAAAAESLRDIAQPEAQYNLGNALAKQGQIEAAINAYEEVLRLNPAHEDAQYNLELLRQAQQEQQEGEKGDEGDQSSDQQSDQSGGEQDQQQSNNSQENPSDSQQQASDSEQNKTDEQQQAEAESKANAEKNNEGGDEEQSDQEESAQKYQPEYQDKEAEEIEQATQQWLRRIPDQPGNLLRNQFLNEFRRNQGNQGNQDRKQEAQPW